MKTTKQAVKVRAPKPRRQLVEHWRKMITGQIQDGPGIYLVFQTDYATNDAVFKLVYHKQAGKYLFKSKPSISFDWVQAQLLFEGLNEAFEQGKIMGCQYAGYVDEPPVA